MHLGNWEDGQHQDHDIHEAVDEDAAEEEVRLVNAAVGVAIALIPDGFNGDALEDGQERAHNDPNHGRDEQNLDGYPDRGELEQAPVEAEEGDFRRRDGGGVGERADPEEQMGFLPGLLVVVVVEVLSETVTHRRYRRLAMPSGNGCGLPYRGR